MKRKILFNQGSSAFVTPEHNYNLMFIRHQELHFNNLLTHRGYVYLNEIYNAFGVKWDPKDENLCCIYDKDACIRLNSRFVEELNGFEIDINW